MRTSLLASTLTALLATTSGCGTDDSTDIDTDMDKTEAPQGVIGIEATASTARVIRNQTLAIAVSITRDENALGSITVTLENLSKDLTAEPVTIPHGATSAVIELSAGAGIALGETLTATVHAVADDGAEASTTIELRLTDKAGAYDVSFGTGSMLVHAFDGGDHEVITSMVRQPDGKLVVAGTISTAKSYFVARYHADGSLDTSFATDGIQVIPSGSESLSAPKIVQRADGTLLVGTRASQASIVYAFDADGGFLDGYGNSSSAAILATSTIGVTFYFHDLALAPDGSVYVSGSSNGDFIVGHLTPEGLLDTSFSGDGLLTVDFGGNDQATHLVLRPDGRVFVSGLSIPGPYASDLVFASIKSDGVLDPTFSSDGKLVVTPAPSSQPEGATLLSDGRIAVNALVGSNTAMMFVQSTGAFDLRTLGASNALFLNSVLELDGSLYAIGTQALNATAVAKLSMSGELDTAFGTAGIATNDLLTGTESANVAVVDNEGRLVLGGLGRISGGDSDLMLTRLWL